MNLIIIIMSIMAGVIVRPWIDFHILYGAAINILRGVNPYTDLLFFSPVHVGFLLIPLTIFGEDLAAHIFTAISFFAYLSVIKQYSKDYIDFAIASLSAFIFATIIWGNIDSIVMTALILPPQFAIMIAMAKPQMGSILAIMIFIREKQRKDWIGAIMAALPTVLIFLVSVLLGFGQNMPINKNWNFSIFPIGIPLAIALMIRAFTTNDETLALCAGPLLSPYTMLMGYMAMIPAAMKTKKSSIALMILSWIVLLIWVGLR